MTIVVLADCFYSLYALMRTFMDTSPFDASCTAARVTASPAAKPVVDRRSLLCLAGLGLVPSVLGCAPAETKVPTTAAPSWHNASSTLVIEPAQLATPTDAVSLIARVQTAAARGKRVRMTGSGHSYSDVALNDDTLLLPNGLERMLTLETGSLREPFASDRHYVRVASGSTLRFVNNQLDALGLALENMGGWDAQTIAGVMMTATHGSGLAFGPIAAQIASMQLVTANGVVLQIEPEGGITDPKRFSGYLPEDPSVKVQLVQSNLVFNAVLVSMGCMGILYAVVVRTVDRYWLRETREVVSWIDLAKPGGYLEALIRRPRDPAFPDHVEVSICPYPVRQGSNDHVCLLTRRDRLEQPPAPRLGNVRGLAGNAQLLALPIARKVSEKVLVDLLDHADLQGLANIHAGFVDVLVDKNYVAKSYEVFNLGYENLLRVVGIEMAFDMADTIRATERMFVIAAEQYEKGRHHSVPVSLRFVRNTDALLAMQNGRDTTMMEIGGLVLAKGITDLLSNYETQFMAEFGARPHWGLDLSILKSFEQVRQLYPHANDWLEVYHSLNPLGTFDARITDRLGISVHPR